MTARRRTPPPAPRSLADDLRSRADADLAALLSARPDLVHPVPPDLTALSVRAAGPSAVRALDRMDRLSLQVAEVLAALPQPARADEVVAAFGPVHTEVAAAVLAALERLRVRALVWGGPEDLRLVRSAADALGHHPCGLGPPAADTSPQVRGYADDPASLAALLDDAPEGARAALEALLWGPPTGRVPDARRPVSRESARTPVEWLLARDLLVPVGPDTVALPREVARVLRGGVLVREPAWPPRAAAPGRVRDPGLVDRTAGQHAFATVRGVSDLLDAWAVAPPSVLRAGGLGVRDLTAAARLLDTDEATAALWAELAFAAGLVAGDLEADEAWAPTPAFDAWRERDPAERWAVLVRTWLGGTRAPGLVGSRESRRVNALGPEVERAAAVDVRRRALAVLEALPAGTPTTTDEVIEVLGDRQPRRRSALSDDLVAWTLSEAESLGVTGLGALSTPGRVLTGTAATRGDPPRGDRTWAGPPPALVEAVAPLLPEPLDHVLLQADLTAVAPGPLRADLARELALAADVESTGGATVYRFTPDSIRRALDSGRDAAALISLLENNSRTPLPQPLRYLVDDVARRHGAVRVGTASAYVRCDDETTLAAVLADRRCAALGLVRLAPTVLAARAPVDEVLAALREAGLAPVAESPDGTVVVRRPDEHRSPVRHPPPRGVAVEPGPPDPALLEAAVRALRAGDRVAVADGDDGEGATTRLPRTTSARTMEVLREALAAGRPVVIGYADPTGTLSQRLVEPVRLGGGFLTAYDHRHDEVRTFAVARITGVAAVDD